MARELAAAHNTVIAISGPRDIISDGHTTYVVNGGNAMMTRVTGSGCTLTGIVAAFAAAAPEDILRAATAAIGLMCLAGDQALEKTGHHATASFHTAMFDAPFGDHAGRSRRRPSPGTTQLGGQDDQGNFI